MNLVIGSAFRLSWDQCKLWVESLERSGYDGDKAIVIFNEDAELFQKFSQHNFKVITSRELLNHEHICLARFAAYYNIFDQLNFSNKYDYVLATDVTDVIFQKNPFDFIKSKNYDIFASSECIRYRDEVWGANNVRLSFGDDGYNIVKDKSIYNAGVIAAKASVFRDLSYLIYSICAGRQQHVPGGGGPDQAAYNILLATSGYNINYISHDEGWACQVGTTADPKKDYLMYNLDPSPKLEDGIVKTSTGKLFHIVHQYNRNPEWLNAIKGKYNV